LPYTNLKLLATRAAKQLKLKDNEQVKPDPLQESKQQSPKVHRTCNDIANILISITAEKEANFEGKDHEQLEQRGRGG